MMFFPNVPRCQHLKVNGTHCGSPALRRNRFCFFHKHFQQQRVTINQARRRARAGFDLPVLEDANAIQVSLMQIMRLLASGQMDPKIAGLLLYALQTASVNLRHTRFEPINVKDVVIDRNTVDQTCIGGDQWSEEDFEDESAEDESEAESVEEDSTKRESIKYDAAGEVAAGHAKPSAQSSATEADAQANAAAATSAAREASAREAAARESAAREAAARQKEEEQEDEKEKARRLQAAEARFNELVLQHNAITNTKLPDPKESAPTKGRRPPATAKGSAPANGRRPPATVKGGKPRIDINEVREKVRGIARNWIMSPAGKAAIESLQVKAAR